MTLPRATERLTFHLPDPRHLPAYYAWASSDRYGARWGKLPAWQAWGDFAKIAGHHTLRGFGPFVAETHARETVGIFGAWHPEGQAEAEIKWTVWLDRLEGQGYAFEAVASVLRHAQDILKWPGAVSYIAPDNKRSANLAARLGARKDGTWTTPSGKEVEVWRHSFARVVV